MAATISPPKSAAAPNTTTDLRVDLTFGAHKFQQMPFMQAVQMVHDYVVTERSSWEKYVGLFNAKHWIVSSVSAAVGSAVPPTHAMWEKPLEDLVKAMTAYQSARTYQETRPAPPWYTQAEWEAYQKRTRLNTAKFMLQCAVSDYNKVHRAWHDYRKQLQLGAEVTCTMMEVAVIVLTTYATAGLGGAVAKGGGAVAKFAGKALVSGAGTLYSEGAKAVGLKVQGVEDINFAKLAEKTLLSMLASKFGDALSDKFLKMMTPKITGKEFLGIRLPNQYTSAQQALAGFLGKSVGKGLFTSAVNSVLKRLHADKRSLEKLKKPEVIFGEVIEEMLKNGLKEAFKAWLKKGGVG